VKNGALALKEVNVSTPRDSFYIRRVRQALTSSFAHDFKIEMQDRARRLLEQTPAQSSATPLYRQELASFDLRDVRVQPDGLVLVLDFRLVVK
jgi:hypothetical protein